jgi:renalase
MKHKKIAIIGAGFAGAVITNRLLQAGYQVTIFEKSRGTGGRLSSCRIGKDSADLGAPWFEPTTDQFRQWLIARTDINRWLAPHSDFSGLALDPRTVYMSTPRQNSLTQNLIKGAMLCTESKITDIYKDSQGLCLRRESEDIKYSYDAVIVTTPAPQAIPLLTLAPNLHTVASSTKTTPNWVAVISLKEKSGVTADILSGPHSTLYRAVRDTAKPGRNSWSRKEIWMLEATSEWSDRHRNSDPNSVGRALIKAFEKVIKQPIDTGNIRVHRWLYARHQSVTQEPYLWDPDSKIGVCSDWLYHQDCEGAWLSANALADHLLSRTKASNLYNLQDSSLIPSRV